MSYPVYYIPAGQTFPHLFDTFAGSTGASITMSGFAVTDIEIYKNGSTTQRASDNGVALLDTDGTDFDSLTGIHGFSIDTSDNSDSGFYTVGAWFHVVVSSVTIDSQTVRFIACAFRIMAAEDSAGVPDVNVTHFGGSAGTFSGGIPAVNATQIEGSDATDQIRDAVVDDATRIDASALNTLSSHDPGGGLPLRTDVTGLNDLSVAEVNAEVDAALSDYDGPTYTELLNLIRLLARSDSALSTDLSTLLTELNANLGSGGGSFSNTSDGQQAIRDRGDLSWVTATGFSTLDAAGVRSAIGLLSANLDTQLDALPTAAENRSEMDSNSTQLGAIVSDTNELQTDWTDGGRLDLILDARASQTSVDTVDSNVDAILDDTGTNGVVVAVASKSGYSLSSAGIQAIWDTLTSALTTVGSIGKLLVDNVNATISSRSSHSANDVWSVATRTLTANTNLNDPTAASIADAVWDEAKSGHIASGSFGEEVQAHALSSEVSALNNLSTAQVNAEIVDVLRTDTLPDSYAADGSQPTMAQAVLAIHQFLTERAVVGTTATVKKPDGTTIAMTFTLDDGTTPTSITRSS